jgi:hypothetical protein
MQLQLFEATYRELARHVVLASEAFRSAPKTA